MGKFTFTETEIKGVYVIEPTVFGDHRGYFFESFSERDFNAQVREIKFDITDIAVGGVKYCVWDMWSHKEYTVTENEFSAKVNSHGARLFKITIK